MGGVLEPRVDVLCHEAEMWAEMQCPEAERCVDVS